jgi:hypothetical protein
VFDSVTKLFEADFSIVPVVVSATIAVMGDKSYAEEVSITMMAMAMHKCLFLEDLLRSSCVLDGY